MSGLPKKLASKRPKFHEKLFLSLTLIPFYFHSHAARVHNAKFHGGIEVTKAIPGLTNRSDYPKGRRSKSWISLTCYVCSQEFASKKEREDHVAEAHPDVTEAQYEAMKTKVELVRRLDQKRRCYAQKAYNDPGKK